MESRVDLLDLPLECEGDLTHGREEHFSSAFGNWLPGDRPELKNFRVFAIGPQGDRIEVTALLGPTDIERLRADYEQYLHDEW